jgi:hypothetical protein
MCCGQKRMAMKVNRTSPSSALNLRYSGPSLIDVRGAATGSLYRFSPAQPVQPVDARDAQPLLANSLFRVSR